MRSAPILTTSLLLALAESHNADGIIQWDVEKRHIAAKLNKRAGSTFQEVLTNDQIKGGYFTSCKVGTPGQDLSLQLDTGSSDTWVPSSQAKVCTQVQRSGGCSLGSFDSAKSSTFKDVGPDDFNISYADGSGSIGDYFTDVFAFGGATLSNLTMGLGLSSSIPYGLIGVGYTSNEASTGTTATTYPNLPVAMVQQGLINSVAYSLWLNDLDSSTGSVMFGGIDTKKYVGSLTRVDVLKDTTSGTFTHFAVALTSVGAASSSGADTLTSSKYPIHAILDSGTTLSYLPTDLAQQIWKEVGAIYLGVDGNNELDMAVVPCSRASVKGNLTFTFGGPSGAQIAVGMDELVLDLTDGAAPKFSSATKYSGQDMCGFGIQNFSSSPYLLGDTFLRSAYVVYDLVNNQVALAATNFNSSESNPVAFPSSGAPIPSATVAPNQNQVEATAAVTSPAFAAESGFNSQSSGSFAPAPSRPDFILVVLVSSLVTLGSFVFVVL